MSIQEMREPTFLVLAALAEGPKHGYAVMRETEELSSGRVRLRAGTLYASLDRLREEGLVRIAGEEIVEGRLRRYFELSEAGGEALDAEIARLESNARLARERIARRRDRGHGVAGAAVTVGKPSAPGARPSAVTT